MQRVAVVTDSSACLPPELAAREGIQVVPFAMSFADGEYRDGLDDPGDFYRRLRHATKLPKTAAPSPEAFLKAFRAAGASAESVLCLTLPANLSSAYDAGLLAVRMAAEDLPGLTVRCAPAGAVAAGQGLIALEAARAARGGAGFDEVAALAESLGREVHFFAFLDTLEYLAKGGHVPKVAAWLGNLAGIRPVLTAPGGDVKCITQARSRRGATERLLKLVAARNPGGAPMQVIIMHADALDEAEAFQETLTARFTCQEMCITQFTPVMGAHSGPGVLGVAFRVVTG